MNMYVFVVNEKDIVKIPATCEFDAKWDFRRLRTDVKLDKNVEIVVKGKIRQGGKLNG